LVCPLCGGSYEDARDDFLLACPEPHAPALLRAVYDDTRLVVHPEHSGVFRYAGWLPVRRVLRGAVGPVTYHGTGLGARLGLDNLLVIFNGYWPEKGARMETCTFKELEAQAVCGRIPPGWRGSLVVSSAGNTARAFHQTCSRHGVPALIVVPGYGAPLLWGARKPGPGVRLAVLEGEADYTDAIEVGTRIAGLAGFYAEGGAKNAARRDGMGTALLSAAEHAGRIPDHYFQAVGSGTGAIAAWEMSLRLAADGRFGAARMRLHLAQNAPFTPMTDAWEAGSRELVVSADARGSTASIHASVLVNRKPPYAVAGGLFDALTDTDGRMYRVSGVEARAAGALFDETEGIDIDPAAEVAVASLRQAVERGLVGRRDLVALNITGGGQRRLRREMPVTALRPDIVLIMEKLRDNDTDRDILGEALA
jgi:cysteate synthase